jgi:hypothetical protein
MYRSYIYLLVDAATLFSSLNALLNGFSGFHVERKSLNTEHSGRVFPWLIFALP